MRVRRTMISIGLVLMLLTFTGRSEAREIRQGDQCVIGANEQVDGNLFALCRTLIINGHLNGNLMGVATKSEINGTVDGDVYLLAGQLDVNGSIGGDLHFAGGVLRVLPSAKLENENSDLVSASLSTTLSQGATIPGGIAAVGYQLVLEGNVGKEVNFWGSALSVSGQMSGNIEATVGDPQSTGISQLQTLLFPFGWDVALISPGLVIDQDGHVSGNLQYSGPTVGVIDGTIDGNTTFTQVVAQPDLTQIITEEQGAERGLSVYLSQVLREFATLGLVGLIGLFVLPRSLQTPIRNIQTRPMPSLGIGLLTFIVAFPVIVIGILLIIALVAVLILLQLDAALLGLISGSALGILIGAGLLFFFMAIFVSRVIVCLWVGRALVRAFLGDASTTQLLLLSLIIGVGILGVLSSLPLIGWIVNALALFLGLGAVVIAIQGQFRNYRDVSPAMPPRTGRQFLSISSNPQRLPPPILDDQPKGVGMDNLPEGFVWWD